MKYSDLNNITTISEALQALENFGAGIEQIKLQLEFPEGRSSEWTMRARYALRKKKGIRQAVCNRLAVLRQQEKERNIALHQHHNDYLIAEMRRYFPAAAFMACVHRAKIKEEASSDKKAI